VALGQTEKGSRESEAWRKKRLALFKRPGVLTCNKPKERGNSGRDGGSGGGLLSSAALGGLDTPLGGEKFKVADPQNREEQRIDEGETADTSGKWCQWKR